MQEGCGRNSRYKPRKSILLLNLTLDLAHSRGVFCRLQPTLVDWSSSRLLLTLVSIEPHSNIGGGRIATFSPAALRSPVIAHIHRSIFSITGQQSPDFMCFKRIQITVQFLGYPTCCRIPHPFLYCSKDSGLRQPCLSEAYFSEKRLNLLRVDLKI